jgi:predicted nucleic acid-binding protein
LIAADSSVVVDLLAGATTPKVTLLAEHLNNGTALLAPATLTELLSAPHGGRPTHDILTEFRLLPILEGYWARAGLLRAALSDWFASAPEADIDGAPGVNVFDLLAFLSCWFPASAGAC